MTRLTLFFLMCVGDQPDRELRPAPHRRFTLEIPGSRRLSGDLRVEVYVRVHGVQVYRTETWVLTGVRWVLQTRRIFLLICVLVGVRVPRTSG